MTITLHHGDLPAGLDFSRGVAIDTETMGLHIGRDRLCLVQISTGDGTAHLVQVSRDDGPRSAPHMCAMLRDPTILKLFHFGRFDIAQLLHRYGVLCAPVYCTKIASKLSRTNTERHGLRDLCRELAGVEISKQQQTSDWGAETLSAEQMAYAASDVLHLHALKERLDVLLAREDRSALAQACFDFLPHRAALDVAGWVEEDIFAH